MKTQKQIYKYFSCALFAFLFTAMPAGRTHVFAEAAMPVIGPEVGNMIPDFSLPDLSGKKIAFSSFRGKKVILYHWATWCTCRFQVPLLQKYYELNKKKNVVLITVAYDSEGEKHVKPFITKNNITVPVLVERTLYLAAVLNFKSTQNAYLIDESGVIKKKWLETFDMNKPEALPWLEEFVNEKPVKAVKTTNTSGSKAPSLSELEEKVKAAPDDVSAHFQLASAYYDEGKLKESAAEYEKVIALSPKFADAYFRLGVVYYQLGDVKMTKKMWRKAQKAAGGFNYFYYRSLHSLEHPENYYQDE